MSPVQASCPACGAPITFKIGSAIVVVCEFCHSVVARGDRKLEDLGKVAEIAETGSPLQIGLKGVYQGVPFELMGRAQLAHQAGGMWDEWYAAFADGRWGWLAEAQGRFYITFHRELPEQSLLPPFEMLQLGQPVMAVPGAAPLMVAEKGVARAVAAKGEIPYRLVPGQEYAYADLSGAHGEFATLDYGDIPPSFYAGREVPFEQLGIRGAPAPEREARRVEALQLSCPQCAGPLELRAPDRTERVTCPNCASLLDVSHGKLSYLKSLTPGKVVPIIPIGATGNFDGAALTVIGFMQRSVTFEGVKYYWEEYLLYNPQVGFRWLVRSDDNWNFVEPVPPGEVYESGRNVNHGGKSFKLYQDTTARAEYIMGEFYWKVTTGEKVRAADYIRPPYMLSKEVTLNQDAETPEKKARGKKKGKAKPEDRRGGEELNYLASYTGKEEPADNILALFSEGESEAAEPGTFSPGDEMVTLDIGQVNKGGTGEINWSLGAFMKPQQVEKAFGISGLPRTAKIAPNQPFLYKKVYLYWLILTALACFLGMFFLITGSYRTVLNQTYPLQPVANAEGTQVIFTDPFDLQANKNVKVSARSPVDNSWLYFEGDLINEETGLVQAFSMPIEYYHGVDGGESWSEGGQSASTHLSALPAGKYTLRLEAQWEKWQQPASLTVNLQQGVPRILYLFLVLVLLSIMPLLVAIYHFSFEKRRWEDSDYSPFQSSG